MHKHLLALSMGVATLAISTSAYARDSSSYTEQGGNSNEVTVTQTTGSNNTVGKGNGTSATVYFRQENGAGSGSNKLTIEQKGSYNTFGSNAKGRGQSYQSGTANNATIEQSGFKSNVDLQQRGSNNGSFGSNVKQSASYSDVNVVENGNQNGFYVAQKGGSFFGGNAIAITQNGDNNFARTSQDGTSLKAKFEQTGYNNNVFSGNDYGTGQTGTGHILDVKQNNNVSYLSGSVLYNTQSGLNQSATVDQRGVQNSVTNTQSGFENSLIATQNGGNSYGGFNNSITSTQKGLGFNSAELNQFGDNNVITSTQDGLLLKVDALQNGASNKLTNNQSGTRNEMVSRQYGTGNTISNTQSDGGLFSFNKANYYQNGTGNAATGVQSDTSNQLSSIQYGNSNVASITQATFNNSSLVSQNGTGNVATIKQ
jgi:hypothetical protein